MSDELNENGLSLKSYQDIVDELVAGYKDIYGEDIEIDSNTADGQLINIFAQAATDLRELMQEVYNTHSPSFCRGTVQDIRFAMNNLQRLGGTFTIVPMTLKINSTVTLQGLDDDYYDVKATAYGFSDDSGAKYYLIDTTTLQKGEYVLPFRAEKMGVVNPQINSIVNPITIKKEVEGGSNNSAPTSIGVDQETDMLFALRRERAIETRAQNSVDAIRSQLLALDGVTDAYVYRHDFERYPDTVDADGIPPHYIWTIVEGGANSDIADVLYANSGGAGMKGEIPVENPTTSGQIFVSRFDRSEAHPLYIKFKLQKTVVEMNFNLEGIKQSIAEDLSYSINEFAETSKITEIIRSSIEKNGGNGVGVDVQISIDEKSWVDFILPPNKKSVFTIDPTRITIDEIEFKG